METLCYSEGTAFALSLRGVHGWALGVVARLDGRGRAFGYVFGPRRMDLPKMDDVQTLDPKKAIWQGRFGDLRLLRKQCPILGVITNWSRKKWRLPPFIRVDSVTHDVFKVTYSDRLDFLDEAPCDVRMVSRYPRDAMSGAGAVEVHVSRLLTALPSRQRTDGRSRTTS